MVAASIIISSPLQYFHVVLPTKKCLLRFFISRSKSLSPFFSLSFAGLPPTFSFSLSFSCSIFQICGHDNIYLSLILQTTLIHKQFSLSVFVFIDSFVVSALQHAGGYAISRQNNLELHLGCHTCWLSYFTLVCLWCGRTVSRARGRCTVTWLPNFLGWVDYFIFLPIMLSWRSSRTRAPLINPFNQGG